MKTGLRVTFHGAFKSKSDAEKKERSVASGSPRPSRVFIQPRTIRGQQRYIVIAEKLTATSVNSRTIEGATKKPNRVKSMLQQKTGVSPHGRSIERRAAANVAPKFSRKNPRSGNQRIYQPTRGVVIAGMKKPPGHPCDRKCKASGHKYQHRFKEAIEIQGLPDGTTVNGVRVPDGSVLLRSDKK